MAVPGRGRGRDPTPGLAEGELDPVGLQLADLVVGAQGGDQPAQGLTVGATAGGARSGWARKASAAAWSWLRSRCSLTSHPLVLAALMDRGRRVSQGMCRVQGVGTGVTSAIGELADTGAAPHDVAGRCHSLRHLPALSVCFLPGCYRDPI